MTTAEHSTARLRLDGVSVRFGGIAALDDVSFEVCKGEIVGLIGPNGAGKTTAFNVVCGFVRPTSGHVSFPASGHGQQHSHDLHRAHVARTLQGVGLFPHLSVLENEALHALGSNITVANLLKAMTSTKYANPGVVPLVYSSKNHQGYTCGLITTIHSGGSASTEYNIEPNTKVSCSTGKTPVKVTTGTYKVAAIPSYI
jgi:ABC-type Fe3+/spermidine/putrescine transport system ATPase subunit